MFDAIPYHIGAFFARFTKDWVCRVIAWTLAEANWWLRPRTRRLIMDNLRIIHPEWSDKERRQCARRTVHYFARSILLFLQLPYYSARRLYERCDMTELRTEVDKLGKGKPFIIATGHVGPWELGAFALVRMGYTVHTVTLDHPNPEVTKFYDERREYVGVHAHPVHGSFPQLKEAIDRGECVALMIDRAYGKAKKRFTMFGVQRDFPLGHLVLSARGRAPVLTGIIIFDGPDRFRYVHGGTHYPEDHEDEFEKLERLQEECLRDLERLIRDHSDHWFHFRPIERIEA